MKQLAIATLEAAEWAFLIAHGWKSLDNDWWAPPSGYGGRRGRDQYRQGHAINSQKYMNNRSPSWMRSDDESRT